MSSSPAAGPRPDPWSLRFLRAAAPGTPDPVWRVTPVTSPPISFSPGRRFHPQGHKTHQYGQTAPHTGLQAMICPMTVRFLCCLRRASGSRMDRELKGGHCQCLADAGVHPPLESTDLKVGFESAAQRSASPTPARQVHAQERYEQGWTIRDLRHCASGVVQPSIEILTASTFIQNFALPQVCNLR
jgi:hypothetical protein